MVTATEDWRGKRCGHNFPPDECPHDNCGFREALKQVQVVELAGDLAVAVCHAAARGEQKDLQFADKPLRETVERIRRLRAACEATLARLHNPLLNTSLFDDVKKQLAEALK